MKYFLILSLSGLFLLFLPDLNTGSICSLTDENGRRYGLLVDTGLLCKHAVFFATGRKS